MSLMKNSVLLFYEIETKGSVHLSALGSTDTLVALGLLLNGLLARDDSRGASKSSSAEVRAVTGNNVSNGLGGVAATLADSGLADALGGRSNLSLGGGDLNTAGSSSNTDSLMGRGREQ
jgi:hypothetical protein